MLSNKLVVLLAFTATIVLAYPTVEMDEEVLFQDSSALTEEPEMDAAAHFLGRAMEDTYNADAPQMLRTKRATCDLLSAFNVGHAACAANCIRMGFSGGYCSSSAVCNCRR